jgi:hypothetical protein
VTVPVKISLVSLPTATEATAVFSDVVVDAMVPTTRDPVPFWVDDDPVQLLLSPYSVNVRVNE